MEKESVFCLQESQDQTWRSLKAEWEPLWSAHTLTPGRAHRLCVIPRLLSKPTHICPRHCHTVPVNNISKSLSWLLPGCSPNPTTQAKTLPLKGRNHFQPHSAFSLYIHSAARDSYDLQSVCPNRTGWFPELSWNQFFLWSYWVFFTVPTQEMCVSWTKGTAAKPFS